MDKLKDDTIKEINNLIESANVKAESNISNARISAEHIKNETNIIVQSAMKDVEDKQKLINISKAEIDKRILKNNELISIIEQKESIVREANELLDYDKEQLYISYGHLDSERESFELNKTIYEKNISDKEA
jgi:hypothetical protein